MNVKQALEYIHGTKRFGSKPGLDTIKELMGKLNNPQDQLRFVHIAGTNGKGSTCAFVASILQVRGYKTGLFISPFIDVFNERIQINRQYISDEDLATATLKVKTKADEMIKEGKRSPTEFELVTAISLVYFAWKKCDIVVWETGLGGRLDATNIVKNTECAVITAIGYDHTAILGDTLGKIAYEKAGIIKENTDVVLYPGEKEVTDTVKDVCKQKNANLHIVDFKDIVVTSSSLYGYIINKGNIKDIDISLLGEHQIKNAAVAIKTCECLNKRGFEISRENIKTGIKQTKWQARGEIIHQKPLIIIDGGHNPQCALALKEIINKHLNKKRPLFIYGTYKDKDYDKIASILFPNSKGVITVSTQGKRGLSAVELSQTAKLYCNNVYISDTIDNAVEKCKDLSLEDDVIIVFGSLSFLADIKMKIKSYF